MREKAGPPRAEKFRMSPFSSFTRAAEKQNVLFSFPMAIIVGSVSWINFYQASRPRMGVFSALAARVGSKYSRREDNLATRRT